MAKAPKSPLLRHTLRFERQQSVRITAIAYLVISMSNTKLFKDARGFNSDPEHLTKTLVRKRKQFIKVTTALTKSVLKEFKDYEEKL